MIRFFLLLLAGLGLAAPAAGQSFERAGETQSTTAYFHHFRPGDATIQVAVWGTVPRPGIYEIREGTDLGKLLTMAGGPPLVPFEKGSRRDITVRLYRQEGARRLVLYEAPFEEMVVETGQYPPLFDDDVLMVETVLHRPFGWRDAITIVGAASAAALAVERIISLAR